MTRAIGKTGSNAGPSPCVVIDDIINPMDTICTVKLPVFEGPLDLLLHLIKKNEIDIYDIPISEITRQYLEYLELMEELNLEIAGEFILMAATLIQIKVRMLLPLNEEIPEEEREDPRVELVERLLQYQAIKMASEELDYRRQRWSCHFFRTETPEVLEPGDTPLLFEVSIFDLLTAFKRILERASPEQVVITRETITVRQKMRLLLERLSEEEMVRFESLFRDASSRAEMIVVFLALLELIRLGVLGVRQTNSEEPIWIVYQGGKNIEKI